jgi:hypothetical protein
MTGNLGAEDPCLDLWPASPQTIAGPPQLLELVIERIAAGGADWLMKPRSGGVVQANPSRDQRACCFGSKAALSTVPYGVPHVPLLRGGTTADRQGGSSVMKVSVEDIPTVPVNQKRHPDPHSR